MKTLKKGKHRFLGTCPNCDSLIEATRGELEIEYDERERGDFGRGDCPECGYSMIFYPKVPK